MLLPHVGEGPSRKGMPSGKLPPIAAAAVSQTTANLAGRDRAGEGGPAAAAAEEVLVALIGLAAAVLLGGGVIAVAMSGGSKPAAKSDSDPDNQKADPAAPPKKAEPPEMFTEPRRLAYDNKTNVEVLVFTPDGKFRRHLRDGQALAGVERGRRQAVDRLEGHAQSVR